MTVGLPGSGIGGVFYLLSALLMPVASVKRASGNGRPRHRLAARQALLAAGIIGALYLTGWAIGYLILITNGTAGVTGAHGRAASFAAIPQIFRLATFALTFGTLSFVLLGVQVLRLFFRPVRVSTPLPDEETREAA